MLELWPFTNFHDLNMDWIVNKIKNVEISEANAKASEEAAAESEHEAGLQAIAARDWAVESKNSADDSEASATDSANSAASIAGVVDQVNTNTSQIQNLIANAGDGTIPSELVDIRVDGLGYTYTIAGDAVRGVDHDILDIVGVESQLREITLGGTTAGIINALGAILPTGANNGVYTNNAFTCNPGDSVVMQYKYPTASTGWAALCWYQADDTWVGRKTVLDANQMIAPVLQTTVDGDTTTVTAVLTNHALTNADKFKVTWHALNGQGVMRCFFIPAVNNVKYNTGELYAIYTGTTYNPSPIAINTQLRTITIPGGSRIPIPSKYPYVNSGTGAGDSQFQQMSPSANPITVQYDNVYRPGGNLSEAVAIVWNTRTASVETYAFDDPDLTGYYMAPFMYISWHDDDVNVSCATAYTINGRPFGLDNSAQAWRFTPAVNSINHKGYNSVAPEDTIPAFQLSKEMGFDMVECDLQLTSDGVPVILHDATINRTARNNDGTTIGATISIDSITYAQALNYDFGIWKGAEYAGTRIPTFEQTCELARALGLTFYAELKTSASWTTADLDNLIDIATAAGAIKQIVFITPDITTLQYLRSALPDRRLGYIVSTINATYISRAAANDAFIDANASNLTDALIADTAAANVELECWTVDTEAGIQALNPYITGVTSNDYIAAEVLYNANV